MDNREFDQIAYQNSYNKENYDRITLMLPKGSKARLKELAEERGTTLSGLLKEVLHKEFGI